LNRVLRLKERRKLFTTYDKVHFIIVAIVLSSHLLLAQDKFTISGHVKDASSGEELIGATIYIEELKSGGTTNVYGFYSLTIPKGSYHIRFSYIGFESIVIPIDLNTNQIHDIELKVFESTLNEVEIKGQADNEKYKVGENGRC